MPKLTGLPVIHFTVTTDINYDQRMIRICSSLANAGYEVVLVGRQKKDSVALATMPYRQKRLRCFFEKGFGFYAEYNIRLFFYLLFCKTEAICAIDLDTILPCYIVSKLRKKKRIYDAHELFCEMKEIVERPGVYKCWKWIERKTVPHFKFGYTVNNPIAEAFSAMYGSRFEVIRSIALYRPEMQDMPREKFILYQGAVNEGRSFETLIPALQWVNAPLIICGDGNFMQQAKELVKKYKLEEKVIFKGMLPPDELRQYTAKAMIGITLFEKGAKSNYYSLANRFFDYIQAGTPQLCVDYPVYRELNNLYNIAVLIEDLSSEHIASQLNKLLNDENYWQSIHQHCISAAKDLNWQKEEIKLISFYKKVFG